MGGWLNNLINKAKGSTFSTTYSASVLPHIKKQVEP